MILALTSIRPWPRLAMIGLWIGSLGMLAASGGTAPAQEPAKTPSHFLFPVTTELQRELIPSKADLFVFVDSTKGITKDEFDLRALELPELRKKLQPLVKGYPRVHFTVFFPKGAPDYRRPGEKLEELAKEMGFTKATNDGLYVNDDISWKNYSKAFNEKPNPPGEDEVAIAGGTIKAYPVKTTLSRWLASNADWVIDLPQVEENQKTISPDVVDSIAAVVNKLKIPPKNHVAFRMNRPEGDQKQAIINDLRKIGKNIGIENVLVMFH